MRKAILASACLIVGYVMMSASCGGTVTGTGQDGGGDSPGGGSAGKGGTAGKGGSAGTGGTAGKGGGGTKGTGGSAGSAGAAGMGGSGGTAGSSDAGSGCGSTAPAMGAMCTMGEGPCSYPEEGGIDVCNCFGMGGGGMPTWFCNVCPACPAMQPTGACMGGGFACGALPPCTYGSTSCTCGGGFMGGTWTCGTCPTTAPMSGDTCTTHDLVCDFGSTSCTCHYGGMMGTLAWDCVAPPPPCPGKEPKPGSACTMGTGGFMGCTYGAANCTCVPGTMGDVWSCT